MKRLTRLEDISYSVEIRNSSTPIKPGASWERKIVILANVVGSDGFVRDEEHAVEFGELKVTRRSVTARWACGSIARPDEPMLYDDGRQSPSLYEMREVVLPVNHQSSSTGRKLILVRDRMVKLLAPQHPWLFRHTEAMDLCRTVHGHIVALDVMGS